MVSPWPQWTPLHPTGISVKLLREVSFGSRKQSFSYQRPFAPFNNPTCYAQFSCDVPTTWCVKENRVTPKWFNWITKWLLERTPTIEAAHGTQVDAYDKLRRHQDDIFDSSLELLQCFLWCMEIWTYMYSSSGKLLYRAQLNRESYSDRFRLSTFDYWRQCTPRHIDEEWHKGGRWIGLPTMCSSFKNRTKWTTSRDLGRPLQKKLLHVAVRRGEIHCHPHKDKIELPSVLYNIRNAEEWSLPPACSTSR